MGPRFQAIINYWEGVWTRPNKMWEDKTPPDWVCWLSPDLLLKPEEHYSFPLYIRTVTIPLLVTLSGLAISYCIGGVATWSDISARKGLQTIFQNPHTKGHTQIIALLYGLTIFFVVVLPLFIVLLTFALQFPRYYFWNRRAARIAHEQKGQLATVAPMAEDKTIWPPPPDSSRILS